MFRREKSRITEKSAGSEAGGFLLEFVGDIASEMLPDSFGFTALIFCGVALLAVLIWAVRFFVQD